MDHITKLIKFMSDTGMSYNAFSSKFNFPKGRINRLASGKQIVTDKIKAEIDAILANELNYVQHKRIDSRTKDKLRTCVSCKKEKAFFKSKEYTYGGNKTYRYVDQDGKRWNGHTCGKCHNQKIKEYKCKR